MASPERRCQAYTREHEPQNAGCDAYGLNPAGGAKPLVMPIFLPTQVQSATEGDAVRPITSQISGSETRNLSRPAHDCHQEGRGDDIAKAEPTIGH